MNTTRPIPARRCSSLRGTRELILALVVGSGGGGEVLGQAEDSPYVRFYFEEARPLQLDTREIAVFKRESRSTERAARLEPFGVEPSEVTELARDWSRAQTPGQINLPADVEAFVLTLIQETDLDFVSPVFLDDRGLPTYVSGEILMRFNPGVPPAQAEAILLGLVPGARITHRGWAGMPGAYRVRTTVRNGFEVLALANALSSREDVKWAEPNMLSTCVQALIPNDPLFADQWALRNTGQDGGLPDFDMDADEAWDLTTGDAATVVVVIDTGVQQDHPDLNQLPGEDFTGNSTGGGPFNDCDDHGTVVAGCISATIDNAVGIAGVAPNCPIRSAKFALQATNPCSSSFGSYYTADLVDAVAWAEQIGAAVTNLSATVGEASSITEIYDQTWANGVVHFAAAGNGSSPSISYPACIDSVIAVASLERDGTLSTFSNWGVGLAFSAPGGAILTTDRTGLLGYDAGDYAVVDGTSLASPYAAGVAALILSVDPTLTPAEVLTTLLQSTEDLGDPGYDTTFGWGLVNAYTAVCMAMENCPPVNDTCATPIPVVQNTVYQGNLSSATSAGSASCGTSSTNPDAWYVFTAQDDGMLSISTCGTHDWPGVDAGMDTVLSVHSGCPGTTGNQLACNDDAPASACSGQAGSLRDSAISLAMSSGQTVYIRVSHWSNILADGHFFLRVDYEPDNDACANAHPITMIGATFSTVGAEDDGPSPCGELGSDIWYSFVAPFTGFATVPTCPSDFDTVLAIYEGCDCPPGNANLLACNDDACGTEFLQASATAYVELGQCYLIQIGGFLGAEGDGVIPGIFASQINDQCDAAVPVGPGHTPFSNYGATLDGPEPCGEIFGRDVWFDYTATSSGMVTISTCDSDFETTIAAYAADCGCPVDLGDLIACDSEACGAQGAITFAADAGHCYKIQVGGVWALQGNGTLSIDEENACSGDTDGNGAVDVDDLLNVVLDWGTDGSAHGADVDGNGIVDADDLVAVILAWGICA